MTTLRAASKKWLRDEDQACFDGRAGRLRWIASIAPSKQAWLFHGGWLAKQQFEEARYCFVYGQYIATVVVGLAFVERTLAAKFYAAGRNDLQRATAQQLFDEAHKVGWLTQSELAAFEAARDLRNPLTHYRRPMHDDLPEMRAFGQRLHTSELLESDARAVLEAAFRLIALHAVPLNEKPA